MPWGCPVLCFATSVQEISKLKVAILRLHIEDAGMVLKQESRQWRDKSKYEVMR